MQKDIDVPTSVAFKYWNMIICWFSTLIFAVLKPIKVLDIQLIFWEIL